MRSFKFIIFLAEVLFLFVSFTNLSYAQAPVTCNHLGPAVYSITNNAGSPYFRRGDIIETGVTLQARPGSDLGSADIVLVMDRTGSMNGGGKLVVAKQALHTAVLAVTNAFNPDIRLSLVQYNTASQVLQTLTNRYRDVDVAIDPITAEGYTSIGIGLQTAGMEIAANGTTDSHKFIILASDGRHNTVPSIEAGLLSVGSDVTIYTIGIGANVDPAVMSSIATTGGTGKGRYYPANTTNLNEVYRDIIGTIVSTLALKEVGVSLTRDDMFRVDFSRPATPIESSYDEVNGIIRWNNLGDVSNIVTKTLNINYAANVFGSNIPLNVNALNTKYIAGSKNCVQMVPINVLRVDILRSGPAPVVDLVIDPSSIYLDQTATVSWSVAGGVDSCTATQGSPGWAGSKNFPTGSQIVGPFVPPRTIDYSLQCTGLGGDSPIVTRTLTVVPPVSGVCGAAHGLATRTEPPQPTLCQVGTPSPVIKNTVSRRWEWTCAGSFGGSTARCSAPIRWRVLIWEF